MLAEFALTPSIFDKRAHKDREAWLGQLRELAHGMFPRGAACPVMVSNLHNGTWQAAALKAVSSIDDQDQEARVLCKGILEKVLARTLVYRPACSDTEPPNDTAWAKEAVNSNSFESIDRIVTCKPAYEVVSRRCSSVRCIDKVQDDHFWNSISSQWSPAYRIPEQVRTLRKVCVHSDFLCLVAPYISGGRGNETDFALEFIKSAFSRPDGISSPNIEIHTAYSESSASAVFPERLNSLIRNIEAAIRSALKPGQTVQLIVWPKFLARYLIGGVYTQTSERVRSPRWGVLMNHIASKADEYEDKPPVPFSLLMPKELGDVFDRYSGSGSQRSYFKVEITG